MSNREPVSQLRQDIAAFFTTTPGLIVAGVIVLGIIAAFVARAVFGAA